MGSSESTKAVLGFKTGSIVHFDGKGNWNISADDLCLPNGIWVDESKNQLFVANGSCHEVIRYDIEDSQLSLASKQSTLQHNEKITIGDNILQDEQGRLWVTTHPCPLDFLAHAEDSKEYSPSEIFIIDPATLKPNKVFQNNGDLISAASTALFVNNRLYISQVLNPYVLVVDGLDL